MQENVQTLESRGAPPPRTPQDPDLEKIGRHNGAGFPALRRAGRIFVPSPGALQYIAWGRKRVKTLFEAGRVEASTTDSERSGTGYDRVSEMSKRFSEHEVKADVLAKRFSEQETKLEALAAHIAEIEKMAENEAMLLHTKTDAMNDRIETLSSCVNSMQAQIHGLKDRMDDLEGSVERTRQAFTESMAVCVSGLQVQVNGLIDRLTTIEGAGWLERIVSLDKHIQQLSDSTASRLASIERLEKLIGAMIGPKSGPGPIIEDGWEESKANPVPSPEAGFAGELHARIDDVVFHLRNLERRIERIERGRRRRVRIVKKRAGKRANPVHPGRGAAPLAGAIIEILKELQDVAKAFNRSKDDESDKTGGR